ncbi:hypothetical protein Bca4012_023402 [Brassica carinata]
MAPNVMFLMETKNDDEFINSKLRSLHYVHYFSVPPTGLSGGLSLFWNDDSDITILDSSPNLIVTRIVYKGVTSHVSFIYGAPATTNRAEYWQKISDVGQGRDTPWLLTGDFNDILCNAEKRVKKKGMFRFNRALTEQEEVTQIIEDSWNASPLDSVIRKLNACRRNIIEWSKEKQIQSNLVIKQKQETLEIALSNGLPDNDLIESINLELRQASLAEEQFWQQRSRIQWLKKGDRNTGFFHAATKTRRTINLIPVIEDEQGGLFMRSRTSLG